MAFAVKAPQKPAPPAPASSSDQRSEAPSQSRTVNFTASSGGAAGTSNYRVGVDSLVRDGDFVVLRLTIACTSATSSDRTCNGQWDFAGSGSVPPEAGDIAAFWNGSWNSVSALNLFDPATGAEYIPVRTDKYALVAGINPSLPPGITYSARMYFPAPPASTSALTVELPNGTAHVDSVPIAPSPPPQP